MTNVQPAAPEAPKLKPGQLFVNQILSNWKGSSPVAAELAAYQIGTLVSGGSISFRRGQELVAANFSVRRVDPKHDDSVRAAFMSGYSSDVTSEGLKERYPAIPANDNDRFEVTWFDEVNDSVVKEEILEGVLGTGEFSLFVAKPGTAKSVLVGDIGLHIAAGLEWHGRKVKQGLVIFFAAERKRLTERRVAAWRKKHGKTKLPFAVVGGKLDLTTGLVDAKALASTISQLETKPGMPCVLVILDTVTRTFGPGDQHQSRDMQKYVQSVDELHRAT
jgi:RecA-family ATPase